MKWNGAKKQTLFLTGINGIVRALGMALRILMSRILGAEIMGVIELAQSVHMVAIAPLTSGLPAAISRLTARADIRNKECALEAGIWLVKITSFFLIPAMWIFSPLIARLMGDVRVLPSLWFTSICVLILGYSAVYNGYSYGIERSDLPAISELIEQLVRFLLTVFLLHSCAGLTVPWLAAAPQFGTLIAEIAGLFFVLGRLKTVRPGRAPSAAWKKAVFRLSAPTTLTRIMQTLLRSFTAIMIPLRLQKSGLSAAEATAQLGMLNGMVMPFLMLPGIFTSALSMVSLPKIAKAEEKPSELRRLLGLCVLSAIPLSAVCAAAIYFGAPILSNVVFHQPDLASLFRLSALQLILFPLNHLLVSTLSALGQQRRSFYISFISTAFTLITTWLWTGSHRLRIVGVIYAQYASQLVSIFLGCIALMRWRHEKAFTDGDKFF